MAPSPWSQLSFSVGTNPAAWLVERTRDLAHLARAFELGLEAASAEGAAALSSAAALLDEWEQATANVWMYAGLGTAGQVPADDVPFHAEELAKVFNTMNGLRLAILEALGDGAAVVLKHEASAKVDDAQVKERAGELPDFTQTSKLGVVTSTFAALVVPQPVTPDELKRRNDAEAKPLPTGADLKACLALLPPPWVAAVFDALGAALPMDADVEDEQELTATTRSALQRRAIAQALHDGETLRQIVFALADEDRELLAWMLSTNGFVRYNNAVAKHGRDDADGFNWNERPPSGAIARVRRTGLASVGMRDNRQVVAIPADLMAPLKSLLG